jgi:hypothetical protein
VSAGTTIAIVLLLCAALAGGGVLWLKQQQIFQREAYQALAARRGWSLTISEQKLGRPAILRLSARSGSGWHTESRLDAGDKQGMPRFLTTEFSAPEPHWPDGCLVLTPGLMAPDPAEPLPQGRSRLSLDARISLAVPSGIAAQLQTFPAPPALTVQATIDPVHRFDLEALAKAMTDWEPQRRSSDGQPVILISPEGFRVRLSHGMRRADQMESFIDFALEVIRVI